MGFIEVAGIYDRLSELIWSEEIDSGDQRVPASSPTADLSLGLTYRPYSNVAPERSLFFRLLRIPCAFDECAFSIWGPESAGTGGAFGLDPAGLM